MTEEEYEESKPKKNKPEKLSDKTLNDRGISWMDMNHSVVIVGWGKEEKSGTETATPNKTARLPPPVKKTEE